LSKIKIVEKNNLLVEEANRIFEKILSMQSEAESQIKDIKSIEKKIMDIQKKKQIEETLLSEKKAMEKIIEMRKADMAKEKAVSKETEEAQNEKPVSKDKEGISGSMEEIGTVKTEDALSAQKQQEAQPPSDVNPIKGTIPEPTHTKDAGHKEFAVPHANEKRAPVEKATNAAPAQSGARRAEKPAFDRDKKPKTDRGAVRGGFERPAYAKDKDAETERHSTKKPQPRAKTAGPDFTPVADKPKAPYESKKYKKPSAEENKPKAVRRGSIKTHGAVEGEDDFPRGSRKRKRKPPQPKTVFEPIVIEKAVITSDTLSVKLFAEKIGKPVSEILKKLLLLGMMCNINSQIDFDTASLVADEFGIELEQKIEQTAEEVLTSSDDEQDDPKDMMKRPPIVTIMGHVDHGKTSLLDKIRSTKVTESEAGGITQHIGAYQIDVKGNTVTFIDTPGHEAFTAMRARGAQVTDVAILVVAADDGVMPQTIEAINHAKSAGVPIIVAINKIDKEGANPEKIKQSLTEYDLVAEEWGGDTVMVPVSAVTGEGIGQLLEMIVLVTDVLELKANPKRLAKGTIVEAKLDKGRGPVATVLIQNGTLHVQDTIVAGTATGRVRAMVDDNGKNVQEAEPSKPVEVIGFSEVPEAGDVLYAVEQDKLSKQVVEERKDRQKAEMLKKMNKVSLDDLFSQIAEGQIKDLNIIIKADVQGSVEAVKQSLEKLSGDEVRVKAIHCGVGAIKETDVMLASAANAIIIGFNVRPEAKAKAAAEHEKVDIRLYRVIYKAIEDITSAMKGMLEPEFEEVVLGHVEVRQTFKVSNVGTIAGCYVTDGKITRNSLVRLLRDNVVIHEGKISSLKRFKDDVKEVAQGYECGVSLENYNDIKEGDVFESYVVQEKER
jgi:translation initiation factor IF-2